MRAVSGHTQFEVHYLVVRALAQHRRGSVWVSDMLQVSATAGFMGSACASPIASGVHVEAEFWESRLEPRRTPLLNSWSHGLACLVPGGAASGHRRLPTSRVEAFDRFIASSEPQVEDGVALHWVGWLGRGSQGHGLA